MAAPAVGVAAKAAARIAGARLLERARPGGQPAPPGKDGGGALKALLAIAVLIVLLPALIVAVLIGGAQQPGDCSEPLPGAWTGPGSLGGVAGTGVTRAELRAARRLGGTRITPGIYAPTAYFPNPHAPATNCAVTCASTASGIRVDNATRRAYLIASNPRLNQYGALAWIQPNPYGWNGPFVVADTGRDFHGPGRLDFYIFMNAGESWQSALGRAYQWTLADHVRVSRTPILPGGGALDAPLGPGLAERSADAGARPRTPARADDSAAIDAGAGPGACGAAPVAPGSLGELSGTPEQIVNRVVLYAREHGFPAVSPDSVRAANDAHKQYTTSGSVSDHKGPPDLAWAADISNGPAPTREEDALARTVAAAFDITWPGAGLATGGNRDYRIQLIYRTCGGGDHFTHVHVGVKRVPWLGPDIVQGAYGKPGCR